jgi:predicted transcriptional regulator
MAQRKSKNRNAYDITASILKASAKGSGRTHIMYRANLSFRLLNEYLARLVNSGLLECQERERRVIYSLSESGAAFLESYRTIQTLYARKLKRLPHRKKR